MQRVVTGEQISYVENLVFDIGLNRGQDTANYLAKGYNVVAVEANPELVEFCSQRFSREIKMGRLAIVYGAILRDGHCNSSVNTVEFFLNGNDAWGTVITDDTLQYSQRGAHDSIQVPIVNLTEVIEEHGMPYYLKTDIEGADIACLEAIAKVEARPAYLSLESDVDSFQSVMRELELLEDLGYNQFQVVNQKDLQKIIAPGSLLEYGGSGDFGQWLPADKWISGRSARRKYLELFAWYKLFSREGLLRETFLQKPLTSFLSSKLGYTIPSWHDTHAKHKDAS